MSNAFIIEHDPDTDQWVTYVWIDGLHTLEDKYLCNGTEDRHVTLVDACERIMAWRDVESIMKREPTPTWGTPSADDVVVEAIAPGIWSVLEASGQRRLVWDHVEALKKGCAAFPI